MWPSADECAELRDDPRLLFSYGWHPKQLLSGIGVTSRGNWEELSTLLGSEGCVSLGEVGLDYTKDTPTKELQQATLVKLLRLNARRRNLPVVIHCRDHPSDRGAAGGDCLAILRQELSRGHHIHRHCFDGSVDEFDSWRRAFPSCYFGITGLATMDYCHRELSVVISLIPEDRLLLETDSPFLKTRGEASLHNSPLLLDKVARYVAKIRRTSLARVLEITSHNARRCYRF